MRIQHRKYCKILNQVIKEAKYMHYNKQSLENKKKSKAVPVTGHEGP
jgi:hypothetical protein